MTAFTYERDLDHPVSAEVDQTIRDVLQELLSSHGLEGVLVNPGLDHDGDPVLFVHLKFRLWSLASIHSGSAIAPSLCAVRFG